MGSLNIAIRGDRVADSERLETALDEQESYLVTRPPRTGLVTLTYCFK